MFVDYFNHVVVAGCACVDFLASNRWRLDFIAHQIQFILSDSNEAGEGEQKLFAYLKKICALSSAPPTIAVVGSDADLFIMSCVWDVYPIMTVENAMS